MARGLTVAIVLAAAGASAQAPRNGPEWDGKDHQPTEAGEVRREEQARVRAPPAEREEDQRTVDQLGRHLLHEEAVDPPRNADRPTPP